ncbi:MAG: ABC transporter ATP-binding protein [Planctomycetota bacterium]|nr:ABC transporter ATP-binding protein [Planctomycetota bacterium]
MLLTTENLCKRYERNEVAVDALLNVAIGIPEGAFVTVTGPSGSGKTTLLLTLAGLLTPTAGRIQFRDTELTALTDAKLAAFRRDHMGFVMQNFSLVPYLSARENVALPIALGRKVGKDQLQRADQLLDRVGLADRAAHLPRELSAGQQQRVAIARSLANEPDLVLADEPTGNLDPRLARDILDLLEALNGDGMTILMVTHSPEAAARGTQRVHLERGQIVEVAQPTA